METILVTGGAGYIGTHTLICLYEAGYKAVVIDNLVNAEKEALHRTEQIIGESIPFYEADVRDKEALENIFASHKIDAVIHFAGLKAVGESVSIPLDYYSNNLDSTLVLLEVMEKHGVKRIVFSSSATVYRADNVSPLKEDMALGCTNPYGWTKYMNEQILRDYCVPHQDFSAVLLRYFNPIGAHESGLIGENPKGIPNNLMPYITQVAVGKREKLYVFGDDYDTVDGTGVRDYIHVMDLAKGHVDAISYSKDHAGARAINLGTGKGTSVLALKTAFEKASGQEIPYEISPRRPGDIATVYADSALAKELLGWEARYDIDRMCEDSWRWQSQNPEGYAG